MSQRIEEVLRQALSYHRSGHPLEAETLYRRAIGIDGANFGSHYLLGLLYLQTGRPRESLTPLSEAVRLKPDDVGARLHQVSAFQALGSMDEALTAIDSLLALAPNNLEGLNCRGNLLFAMGRAAEALQSYETALGLAPADPALLNNRGNCLRNLKRLSEALQSYEASLTALPNFVDALNNRATALRDLGRIDEAMADYDRALTLRPDFAEVHCYRGRLLFDLKRYDEALRAFENALRLKPNFTDALDNRGTVLRQLNQPEEALASYTRALALKPFDAKLIANCGHVLIDLGRTADALKALETALKRRPTDAEILNARGVALQDVGCYEESLASFDAALISNSDSSAVLSNRGFTLLSLQRPREAIASFDAALTLDSEHASVSGLAMAVLEACAWERVPEMRMKMSAAVAANKLILPFVLMAYGATPPEQYSCAGRFADKPLPPPLWTCVRYRHPRIRIAYLSADFHEHATAYLMAGMFEAHDRAQFEILGISYGPDDRSPMRARLEKGFDRLHDVRGRSDAQIARLLRALEVDIAIDLKGYTRLQRSGILGYRPCPVQVNYLGFPGTMANTFIDYIIADPTVVPFAEQHFFSEKIVHLPDTYQANDDMRIVAEPTPSRESLGLPAEGLVLCCFNNSWKIGGDIFAIWMRVLRQTPQSVLWLLEDSADARISLKAYAAASGVTPERLVFAPRLKLADHLARHRRADLFLDTLPYNAHTTASDSVWAGVPLVTCRGTSFPSRVSASLLNAAGLAELVTENLSDYEALILALTRNPERLRALREKLARNRVICPLFDTARFTRHIEAAYTQMWTLAEAGQPPQSFAVPCDGRS